MFKLRIIILLCIILHKALIIIIIIIKPTLHRALPELLLQISITSFIFTYINIYIEPAQTTLLTNNITFVYQRNSTQSANWNILHSTKETNLYLYANTRTKHYCVTTDNTLAITQIAVYLLEYSYHQSLLMSEFNNSQHSITVRKDDFGITV